MYTNKILTTINKNLSGPYPVTHLKRVITLNPNAMKKVSKVTQSTNKSFPARIINKSSINKSFKINLECGPISIGSVHSFMKKLHDDKWSSIVVKRYPITINNAKIKFTSDTYKDFNQYKSLLALSILGISYLDHNLLVKGKGDFELSMIYYPNNILKPSFTEFPHNDSYKSTCLFDLSETLSKTHLYLDIDGDYLINFMNRNSGEGMVFPQKEKYSITELGIDLDIIKEVYAYEKGAIKLVQKYNNLHQFNQIISKLKANSNKKFSILHQASGNRPRVIASVCQELVRPKKDL